VRHQPPTGSRRETGHAVAQRPLGRRFRRLLAGVILPLSAWGAAFAVASPPAGAATCGSSGPPPTGACTYSYTGSPETFTVPAGVTQVTINAAGAQGGRGNTNAPGGAGAHLQATFAVTPAEVLNVVVGGQGATVSAGGGGGGGSFVYTSASSSGLLLAAAGGGGGGGGGGGTGSDASSSTTASAGSADTPPCSAGPGGTMGHGGGASTGCRSTAGSGGGLLTDGADGPKGTGGKSLVNGAAGGVSTVYGAGGFGGGGAATSAAGGGGGGYNGGGGGAWFSALGQGGGGGGSFTAAGATGVSTLAAQSGNGQVTISYLIQAPTITSADSATFTTGHAGSFQVTATGSPAPTYSLLANPPWLSIDPGTGLLTGTPPAGAGGTYPFGVLARNGVSPDAAQTFTLTVREAPAITSPDSAVFVAGEQGSFQLTATGNPPPHFSKRGPALPSGLTLSPTGLLSGTPAATSAGVHHFTVVAKNGVSPRVEQAFTLTVAPRFALVDGELLPPGQELVNGSFSLVLHGNGNLVEYKTAGARHEVWSTHTAGHRGAFLVMQSDGNLVLYTKARTPLWSSRTSEPGSVAVLWAGGRFAVVSTSGVTLWSNGV
jgi:hypothetical protein